MSQGREQGVSGTETGCLRDGAGDEKSIFNSNTVRRKSNIFFLCIWTLCKCFSKVMSSLSGISKKVYLMSE